MKKNIQHEANNFGFNSNGLEIASNVLAVSEEDINNCIDLDGDDIKRCPEHDCMLRLDHEGNHQYGADDPTLNAVIKFFEGLEGHVKQ